MAIFRKVHTSFWSDSFNSELTTEQKLFYIYLLTNERTKQCGVYEITKKQISFDLGYSIDKVSILIKYFISKGKIKYNEVTKEIAIGNWLKYNSSTSPKVVSCINKEFLLVKDSLLIEYVKSMDTLSQEEQEQEQEQEQEENKKFNFKKSLIDLGAEEKLVGEWLSIRKKKRSVNSETALKGFLNQQERSGLDINSVLTKCIERSWSGFEAEWISGAKKGDVGKNYNEHLQKAAEARKLSDDMIERFVQNNSG